MASGDVYNVFPQPAGAAVVVRCQQGVIRVGDVITHVTRADGATRQVELVIQTIDKGFGPTGREVRAGTVGRLEVTGAGVDALAAGTQIRTGTPTTSNVWAAPAETPTPATGDWAVAPTGEWSYAAPALTEIELLVVPPERQRRWTVLFRALLAIPVAIVMLFIYIGVTFAAIAGWFAALVLGELPQSLHSFIGGAGRLYARFNAYIYLLTDRYPPIDLAPRDYPVELVVPEPRQLGRWLVFFRFFVTIPAGIVSGLVTSGWSVIIVVGWAITLILGRLPKPLHDAGAAILRFQMRTGAYFLMLTPTYPAGLFRRPPQTAEPADGDRALIGGTLALVVIALIVGLVYNVTINITNSHRFGNFLRATSARSELNAAHNRLGDQIGVFQSNSRGCAGSSDALRCQEEADRALDDAFGEFAAKVASVTVPSNATQQLNAVANDASRIQQALETLVSATSLAQYRVLAQQVDLTGLGQQFDQDWIALAQLLR